MNSPGLEFLEGTHFWEAYPRYAGNNPTSFDTFYRQSVGVDAKGASLSDSKDVSTFSHMFGCWETLHIIKAAMETGGYRGPQDKTNLIEAMESMKIRSGWTSTGMSRCSSSEGGQGEPTRD